MSEPLTGTLQWAPWQPQPLEANVLHVADAPAPVEEDAEAAQEQYERIFTEASEKGYQAGFRTGMAEGRTQGRSEGRKKGLEEARAEIAKQAKAQASQLTKLARDGVRSLTQLENELGASIMQLAIRMAEHVLHDTLDSQPEKMQGILAQLLRMRDEQGQVLQLSVHPDDLALVQEYLTEEDCAGQWQLIGDEGITHGGCRLSSALGDIDATLETRWQRAIAGLENTKA